MVSVGLEMTAKVSSTNQAVTGKRLVSTAILTTAKSDAGMGVDKIFIIKYTDFTTLG